MSFWNIHDIVESGTYSGEGQLWLHVESFTQHWFSVRLVYISQGLGQGK